MAVGKVTISSVSKLEGWLWDTHCVGFGARRQTNGVFYYVRYRHGGSQIVRSIGRHGPFTPDTARAKARQLRALSLAVPTPSRKRWAMASAQQSTATSPSQIVAQAQDLLRTRALSPQLLRTIPSPAPWRDRPAQGGGTPRRD